MYFVCIDAKGRLSSTINLTENPDDIIKMELLRM